ncbi:CheR family methyltransferase [Mesorhizobium sp. L-8-3]|uniref:CheR family methyltransferase n=1 Tax=Mesorhizobium sp. L-8-3 TaxID=2744522 RepID=UPI001929056E|nr:protein-glutamate O-methyltransferase [Mesorhizobium sp. L-8-3]BCH23187.1 chemotaxis protein methyltransferase [Mesorhizobium sp. L-8-3]
MSATREAPALVPGEYLLTMADFRQIAAILHDDAGISLSEAKAALVYARLAKRLRALGLSSFRDYCALVSSGNAVDERQKLVAALTTNVTKFFREKHHFDHLQRTVLPQLVARARRGGQVRIWSAGCSNGQEAYSAALVILQMMPDVLDCDFKILASDIDPNMVAEGRAGLYSDVAVEDVPAEIRNRWLRKVRDGGELKWQVPDEARELVAFRELNLFARWPMKRPFDVIFCRNVAIYFDKDKQAELWARFAGTLLPGGYLYIGHSERIAGPAADIFVNDGITTWRRAPGSLR